MLPLSLLKTAQAHPVVSLWTSSMCTSLSLLLMHPDPMRCAAATTCLPNDFACTQPTAVGGAQEWGDIQWACRQLRLVDEHPPAGSYLHFKGARQRCNCSMHALRPLPLRWRQLTAHLVCRPGWRQQLELITHADLQMLTDRCQDAPATHAASPPWPYPAPSGW
jgi:hypothetical protein